MNVEHLITPYKYNRPVLTGSGIPGTYNSLAVDCPTVFVHNGQYYMMYVGYDGVGYQTALAVSDDLLHWTEKGVILGRSSERGWNGTSICGNTLLMDNDLYGTYRLKKYCGRYWLMYHAYPRDGYETGSAEIGLCWSEDEELLHWHMVEQPVFSWRDGAAWERGGLYKCFLMEHENRFYLFYNAKDAETGDWTEQIGMAVSDDLFHWSRPFDHPVLPVTPHAWDGHFASDPQVFYDGAGKQWVMFYYGLGDLSACDGVAVSDDLYHWRKFPAPILTIGHRRSIDAKYAHKPAIFYANGSLYHFYCACRASRSGDPCRLNDEFRCISVARSTPWEEPFSE